VILIVREERLSAQLASPSKRIKVDEQATTSSEQNVTNASAVAPNGNERLQLCADLENAFLNAVPTAIHYCRKIILQPEELLLYSLVNIALPPGTKLGMCSAEKYAGISLSIYKVYGVCFWSQYALSGLEESERS
jgi:hypothetical protein